MHVSEPGVERRAGDERPPQKVQSMSVPSAFGSSKRRVMGASQVESGKFILLQKVLVPGASVCCSSDLVGVRLEFKDEWRQHGFWNRAELNLNMGSAT